ncbi:uroporphyrinogen-III synthase [Halalkalibacter alkalisediminis]|uniref:Uroporphyrinogen-III synthase n=1 Tax=Halalkalibacter alkalisediminis TaxID=935616 RepID=A0ABV6NC82_9BACI|nr:uroporphyrinogen-III synthase [Halalkalibacter alkalisediminis]
MSTNPLAGKTVLVTRAKEQAQDLSLLIAKQGGTAIEVPLIAFKAVSSKELETAIHNVRTYQWLIFTSANGVRYFIKELQRYQYDLKQLPLKIAVVGTKTEQMLECYDVKADLLPVDFVAEGLVEALSGQVKKGDRVLVARGNLGRIELITGLTALGAMVDDVSVYRTIHPPEAKDQLEAVLASLKSTDYITFTSSSTVHHFIKIIQAKGMDVKAKIACIGPIAARTAKKYGLTVTLMPSTYTIEHLVDQLILDSKENV